MPVKDKKTDVLYNFTTDINYLEEENRILKEALSNLKAELTRFKMPPLLIAEVKDVLDENQAIVRLSNGNEFLVNIVSDAKNIMAGDSVFVEQKNLTVVRKNKSSSKRFNVEKFVIIETPKIRWNQVGGLKDQEKEIKEVIELPLKKPKLFEKIGIQPPKGVLLHGPPGTGKTLLAKAVASSTKSTFIEIVASELVQKFIGEGAKLIKEIFELAREKSPAIIFIDELDALAAKRIEIGTSGEREVQRTFMQLLAEVDGFKHLGNIKIIGCTNRKDILDPAILRPGRLDRIIEVGLPDKDAIKQIFKIHTKNMSLDKSIKKDKIIASLEGFSGAEIRSVCTEAGYFAIRANRTTIKQADLIKAIQKVRQDESKDKSYSNMFG